MAVQRRQLDPSVARAQSLSPQAGHGDLCACPDAVSLRRELVAIFGVPKLREGETWNDAMLRQITSELAADDDGERAAAAEAREGQYTAWELL